MLRFKRNKIVLTFLFTTLFISGIFLINNNVLADTETRSVDVNAFTQPQTQQQPPPSSGGGGGGDTAPTISNVSTSSRMTSTTVSWEATDDVNVKRCEFNYSTGVNYNNSASVTSSGVNYSVQLNQLSTSTQYNFKITCYDKFQNTEKKGKFTTLSQTTIDLEILAEPEKRVNGNKSLKFNLIMANPRANNITYTLNDMTSSTGKFSKKNVVMPSGKDFVAVLKGRSHLAKRVVGVNVKKGKKLTLDFTDQGNFKLLAGDVAGTGLKDNFVDVLDISSLLTMNNTSNKEGDLNRDGIVDALDISIILKNINKCGDNIPKHNKQC
ncbi:MAG: hypothetical protein BRC22_03155 [Parcubacteria group bacterium QH_9_35_7]|nr:MAG: hypothetical protein BRC22_03155 [Parcubacteria group bacterium QH_9_35_7]